MTHLKLQDYFTTDEEALGYRLDIVEDMVKHREWYDLFCKAIPAIQNVSDLMEFFHINRNNPRFLNPERLIQVHSKSDALHQAKIRFLFAKLFF